VSCVRGMEREDEGKREKETSEGLSVRRNALIIDVFMVEPLFLLFRVRQNLVALGYLIKFGLVLFALHVSRT